MELSEPFWADLSGRLRTARLTFGGRVHCPFLRPLFLADDVALLSRAAEAIAAIGERVVQAALEDRSLLDAVGLTDDEQRLVRWNQATRARAPPRAWTASCCDLWFAEYAPSRRPGSATRKRSRVSSTSFPSWRGSGNDSRPPTFA